MSSGPGRERYQVIFQEEIARHLSLGLDKQQAAAKALVSAYQKLKKAKLEEVVEVKVSCTFSGSQAQYPSSSSISEEIPPLQQDVETLSFEKIQNILSDCITENSFTAAIKMVGKLFSDSAVLNSSFCLKSDSEMETKCKTSMECSAELQAPKHEDCEDGLHTIFDIEEVHQSYAALLNVHHEGIINSLIHALESLTYRMQHEAATCRENASVKQFLVVLEHPELLDPKLEIILRNLLMGLDRIPVSSKVLIVRWLGRSVGFERYKRYISYIKQYTTLRIYQGSVDDARLATRVLEIFHSALPYYGSTVSHKEFYNDALNEVKYLVLLLKLRNSNIMCFMKFRIIWSCRMRSGMSTNSGTRIRE